MDSLTQIVLGAAVGEVILGKKLGNKAMVWGAIAGTIPDLDIIGNLFLSDLDALAFHRGISHSIFFAITFSFFLAYIAKTFYQKQFHTIPWLRTQGALFGTGFVLLLAFVFGLIGYTAGQIKGLLIVGIPATIIAIFYINRIWKSRKKTTDLDLQISYRMWYIFFFWAVFTHPILDCCTVYGTQLFAPFSDYRVSWDNISVADPIYTFLFGTNLLIAGLFHRNDHKRRIFNYLGIALSMLYMAWTVNNKVEVNHVMEDTLAKKEIEYSRYMTAPTILNNILWSGTVDSDSSFWIGQYSLLDKVKEFKLKEVSKNYHLIQFPSDKTLKVLEWFSKDYCAVLAREDGKLQVNDLRYGQFDLKQGNHQNNYIFRFVLDDNGNGYELGKADGGPPPGREKEIFSNLWNRIIGE